MKVGDVCEYHLPLKTCHEYNKKVLLCLKLLYCGHTLKLGQHESDSGLHLPIKRTCLWSMRYKKSCTPKQVDIDLRQVHKIMAWTSYYLSKAHTENHVRILCEPIWVSTWDHMSENLRFGHLLTPPKKISEPLEMEQNLAEGMIKVISAEKRCASTQQCRILWPARLEVVSKMSSK